MAVAPLTLIANPGSASRKYALYNKSECVARLHFEWQDNTIICNLWYGGAEDHFPVELQRIQDAPELIEQILTMRNVLDEHKQIARIALRIVAPSSFFLQDHLITDEVVAELERAVERAPLHIRATLEELHRLRAHFPGAQIVGVSDSAFHSTKPDYAWNYGLPLDTADSLDIKRFGYHGLSVASAVDALVKAEKLAPRVVVCHLGGGASVSAVFKGRGFDTTMGYSPLEGLIMATRSGSIDPTAVRELKFRLGLSTDQVEEYLNQQSGLLGLSGSSSDIRELLDKEEVGDHRAELALATYVFGVQKAIGQMIAALGGIDLLVFTGTVGERSVRMRERIVANLEFADLIIDKRANKHNEGVSEPVVISRLTRSRPIIVIPADEAGQMLKAVERITGDA